MKNILCVQGRPGGSGAQNGQAEWRARRARMGWYGRVRGVGPAHAGARRGCSKVGDKHTGGMVTPGPHVVTTAKNHSSCAT